MFTGSVRNEKTFTERGVWEDIFAGDRQGTDGDSPGSLIVNSTRSGAFGFPQRDRSGAPVAHVVGSIYLNVHGALLDGHSGGIYDVRALRVGTENDTSWKDHPFLGTGPGGSFQTFHTHPPWEGANPKGFVWQIRLRQGIESLTIGTRYAKHYGVKLIP